MLALERIAKDRKTWMVSNMDCLEGEEHEFRGKRNQ